MKEDINVKCALCGYPIHDTVECDNQLHATCNLVVKRYIQDYPEKSATHDNIENYFKNLYCKYCVSRETCELTMNQCLQRYI